MSTFNTFLISVFICSCSISGYAQASAADTGKIEVVQDARIKELVAKHIEVNSKTDLRGYRIKIHFGSDKSKALEIKSKFISKFPDVPAYGPIYDQPNFTVRVGDFRTKLEAYRFLKEVQTVFPSAFIVQDNIEFPQLDARKSP